MTFTDPEVAHVGVRWRDAVKQQGGASQQLQQQHREEKQRRCQEEQKQKEKRKAQARAQAGGEEEVEEEEEEEEEDEGWEVEEVGGVVRLRWSHLINDRAVTDNEPRAGFIEVRSS